MFASINFRTKRGSLALKVVRNSEEFFVQIHCSECRIAYSDFPLACVPSKLTLGNSGVFYCEVESSAISTDNSCGFLQFLQANGWSEFLNSHRFVPSHFNFSTYAPLFYKSIDRAVC
jgi:hypothetical protein